MITFRSEYPAMTEQVETTMLDPFLLEKRSRCWMTQGLA